MTIDAHLHLWDLDVSDYAWLGPQHGPLHRSFGPDEAARELRSSGIEAAVLVQAEDSLADTGWLLDVARTHDWVLGVVGWVPLDRPDQAATALADLDEPALRGVRHLIHDDPRAATFLGLAEVRESLRLVAERGLVLDVPDAWPTHLDAVGDLAEALPGLTIVVDHLAKPPWGTAAMSGWAASLRAVAQRPNVVAKVSGLAGAEPYTAATLRPVLDTALDAFGAHRLMYGGDWPMATARHDYAGALGPIAELVSALSPHEQAEIRRATALRVYGRVRHD
ncbi:amidohydrolase [Pimelobacter sp. 30-1]|uniref:amidohydrolase family protein n=1 Tax=Pimelobacter sp. 30-1 TaxID=2004991 RepID=UPI001C052C01|nr:amidohydrolase family protein [Pimelobacter sp. 30-1]MBU2693538.1 hypothetical protein [Pimelobacter sp. 30-1]